MKNDSKFLLGINQNRVTAKRQLQARGLASKPATPAARIIILIILNKIYKLLVENLFFGRQEETGEETGDGSVSPIREKETKNRPLLLQNRPLSPPFQVYSSIAVK